ncbi:hypothetical protein CONLIGDRAFT_14419 [Coniochaeta ligniaria NRRL 30616]|uniref:F-box domain-containing protein n=1 Tax=Coniochaeta ligniaria NRRL 30616 TaxID=1408157 RepID=A0A1J7J4D9_9PEZI|nr:hypothetical protein CONLIGDRAFT_14419 [Coniochaeta ligniaria NRRL 30616]
MLTQIPTEVLTNILDHLVRPYSEAVDDVTPPTHIPGVDDESWWYVPDYRSLSSVCLTSRKLRDIGQRVLYHSFKLDHGRVWSDYWEEDREYTWKGRLIMFLRTLLLRPDLAALVRTCFITAHLVAAVGEKEAKQALRNAARIRGVDLSKFLQPFRASAWCERPMRDGVLVMILACLPNLSGLYLSGALDEEGENTMFFNIFRPSLKAAGVTSLGLQTLGLELVRDDYERHRTRTRRPCVADLLEMASSTLQNFYALNCEFDLDSLAQPLPKLRNVSVAPDDVDYTPLLSSCEGLERFALHGK